MDTGPSLLSAAASVIAVDAHVLSVVFATLVGAGYYLPALPMRVLGVTTIAIICFYYINIFVNLAASYSFRCFSKLLKTRRLDMRRREEVRHNWNKFLILIALRRCIIALVKPKEIHKGLLLLLEKKKENLVFLLF